MTRMATDASVTDVQTRKIGRRLSALIREIRGSKFCLSDASTAIGRKPKIDLLCCFLGQICNFMESIATSLESHLANCSSEMGL